VALSATLLFGASLLTRGVLHASSVDPGYPLHGITVARVTLPSGAYDAARARAFREQLRESFAIAGLGPVAFADFVPLEPSRHLVTSVRRPMDAAADSRQVHLRSFSANAYALLDIPLVAGRVYEDRAAASEVMVNEAMARAFWPGGSAVGERLIDGSRVVEVVGVVRDVQLVDLAAVEPTMFSARMMSAVPALLLKTVAQPAQVRAIVQQLDGRATVTVAPLLEALRESLKASYIGVVASWLVGALALILAVGGVFGVFSYLVEERTREIGIRVALGARRAQILAMLFGGTRHALLAGAVTAIVLSLAAGQVLRAFLFGLSPFDPLAFAGAAAILAAAAAAATVVPARRAMRVDPVVALRHE
jgi:hypothetical protein